MASVSADYRNEAEGWSIEAGFPGGNVKVVRVEGAEVHIEPDMRECSGKWFYWAFRVSGAEGRTLNINLPAISMGLLGPAVSTDGGATWRWLYDKPAERTRFSYTFANGEPVYFCLAFRYTSAEFEAFLRRYSDNPGLRRNILATSRRGREVPYLQLGARAPQRGLRLFLSARHHACEMMASYVLEGIMEAILVSEEEWARWLRDNVEVTVVPITDFDGVEDGEQGKNRIPRDHNRDYGDDTIYPEVRAIKELAGAWGVDRKAVAMDIHCPYIYGGRYNERIYMVGNQDGLVWDEQQQLAGILERVARGLPYRAEDNLPFGQDWNHAGNYGAYMSCSRWFAVQPQIKLATAIEIPYAVASGEAVTDVSAREFGRSLAQAFSLYMQDEFGR